MKRPRLTTLEIETILAVAGDALAEETLSNPWDEAQARREIKAYHNGIEKLRDILALRRGEK